MSQITQNGIYIGNLGFVDIAITSEHLKEFNKPSFKMVQSEIYQENSKTLDIIYCVWDTNKQHIQSVDAVINDIFKTQDFKWDFDKKRAIIDTNNYVQIVGAGKIELSPEILIGYGRSGGFNNSPNENHLRKIAAVYGVASKVDIDYHPNQ